MLLQKCLPMTSKKTFTDKNQFSSVYLIRMMFLALDDVIHFLAAVTNWTTFQKSAKCYTILQNAI